MLAWLVVSCVFVAFVAGYFTHAITVELSRQSRLEEEAERGRFK